MDYQPISPEAAAGALKEHPSWVVERSRIYRDLRFDSFAAALAFVNQVGNLAERVQHHPNIRIHEWCFVQLELYTDATAGLTTRDVEFAIAVDDLMAAAREGTNQ
jgi:4a-hydroxytetrahydrobiopterin dehydratase